MERYILPTALQQLIVADQAYRYRVIPHRFEGDILIMKAESAGLPQIQNELAILLGREILIESALPEEMDMFLNMNYRRATGEQSAIIQYSNDILEKILLEAKSIGSSDIHFEQYENRARVRFRLDGKLKEHFFIPKSDYAVIINKIKIRAQLDISEKRLPQDGRITVSTGQQDFDIRVSVLPTLYGEKIVLRILHKDTANISLEVLGFRPNELSLFLENLRKPNGIILISGPTGSGKTTTLYASLKYLNKIDTNILTIEDPIEYTLEGINQVQLKENIGLDFAATMRTFLRQDPDIIMVGEIRDVNTANMAIRAALTGHLVLSTIHTNSAWATISRLIDMGIPSFLIANSLNMSVAQRLIRKLCSSCKQTEPVSKNLFPKNFKIPADLKVHSIPGKCGECYYTGFTGRQAIYEILPIDSELSNLIKINSLSISNYLHENSIITLKDNAISMVKEGITSIDEVYSLLM